MPLKRLRADRERTATRAAQKLTPGDASLAESTKTGLSCWYDCRRPLVFHHALELIPVDEEGEE